MFWAVLQKVLSLSFVSLCHIQYIHYTTLKVNCLVSIIHLLELFIVFNTFQLPIIVLLWHFCWVIQEMDMESSSSKQGNFFNSKHFIGRISCWEEFSWYFLDSSKINENKSYEKYSEALIAKYLNSSTESIIAMISQFFANPQKYVPTK